MAAWGVFVIGLVAGTAWWRRGGHGELAALPLQAGWMLVLVEVFVRVWAGDGLRATDSGRSPGAWTVTDHGLPELQRKPIPTALLSMDGRAVERSPLARILVVGDSFAAGEGVQPGQDIASQLAQLTGAEVRNHGLSGLSFFEEAALYDDHGRLQGADVVVWLFVLNDLGSASPSGAVRSAGIQGPFSDGIVDRTRDGATSSGSVALDLVLDLRHRMAVERVVEAAYQRGYDPAQSAADLDRLQARLRAVHDDLAARGARLVFAVWPILHELDAYPFAAAHAELVARANAAGAEAVDLQVLFAGEDARSLWASPADHHPNAQAQARAARLLAERIGPITRAQPVPCKDGSDPLTTAQRARCERPADPTATLNLAAARLAAGSMAEPAPYNRARLATVLLHEALALGAADPAVRDAARALLPQIDAAADP